jgi:hypothetical protein
MTTTTEYAYNECAPYPRPSDKDPFDHEPVPPSRARQYVGPIYDLDGVTRSFAPALIALAQTEPEDQP